MDIKMGSSSAILLFPLIITVSCFICSTNGVCQKTNVINNRASSYIVNEGYPDKYYNGSRCAWHVTTAPGTAIRFHLLIGQLEMCSGCSCDHVEIYDGASAENSRLLIRACKADYTDSFTTSSNVGFVYFYTDSSGVGLENSALAAVKGFHVHFEEVPADPQPNTNLIAAEADISGRLWTEQFLFGEYLVFWRDDLKDTSSPIFTESKELFENALKLIYRQAGLNYKKIEVIQFKKHDSGEVNKTVAEYVAIINAHLPARSTGEAVEYSVDGSIDLAITVLHQSGVFYNMFKDGPMNYVDRLVLTLKSNSLDYWYNKPISIAAGTIACFLSLILSSLTFTCLIRHNRRCRRLTE